MKLLVILHVAEQEESDIERYNPYNKKDLATLVQRFRSADEPFHPQFRVSRIMILLSSRRMHWRALVDPVSDDRVEQHDQNEGEQAEEQPPIDHFVVGRFGQPLKQSKNLFWTLFENPSYSLDRRGQGHDDEQGRESDHDLVGKVVELEEGRQVADEEQQLRLEEGVHEMISGLPLQ